MGETTARGYYEAIDGGDYETFANLLAPEVVHRRPDRSVEGRETLVEFMRDGRPNKETAHEIDRVYPGGEDGDVAVEGRLLDADGAELFGFVDCFAFENGRIAEIRTYTR